MLLWLSPLGSSAFMSSVCAKACVIGQHDQPHRLSTLGPDGPGWARALISHTPRLPADQMKHKSIELPACGAGADHLEERRQWRKWTKWTCATPMPTGDEHITDISGTDGDADISGTDSDSATGKDGAGATYISGQDGATYCSSGKEGATYSSYGSVWQDWQGWQGWQEWPSVDNGAATHAAFHTDTGTAMDVLDAAPMQH